MNEETQGDETMSAVPPLPAPKLEEIDPRSLMSESHAQQVAAMLRQHAGGVTLDEYRAIVKEVEHDTARLIAAVEAFASREKLTDEELSLAQAGMRAMLGTLSSRRVLASAALEALR